MAPPVELSWSGKRSAQPTREADLRETRRGDPKCLLVSGENLTALRALGRVSQGQVALVYLDPPFFTGKEHQRVRRVRRSRGNVERTLVPAFDDRWASFESYLQALRDRLVAARELLCESGCLVLHVDPKTSHYARVLGDEVFGFGCFASEIVWRYRRWPAKTRNFQRVHDTLLRFVKNPRATPRFNQLYEPLATSTLATWGSGKQRAVVSPAGVRTRSSATRTPSPGAPLGDVWEIGIVGPVSKQRTGYPTQKPQALLERLIHACTDPEDLVLDAYVGSGTTLAAAHQLGRASIGIDQSPEAISVTRARLAAAGITPLEQELVPRPSSMDSTPTSITRLRGPEA